MTFAPFRLLRLASATAVALAAAHALVSQPASPLQAQSPATDSVAPIAISETDCTASRVGRTIPIKSIGEPVSAVNIGAPRWAAAPNLASYCVVDGEMLPIDTSKTARPIYFRIAFPSSWNRRAAQLGGGGFNGTIPNLAGGPDSPLGRGYVTYGSDSGHQTGGGRGAAPDPSQQDWVLNDEAMKNLGYMQMKKTRDAAMVLVERMYRERPRYTYFIGTSQGGREALTVAQRYPADYDGIVANVPIVNFSTLMLAPELIRIQEKRIANWVTPAKVNAIRAEFVRQCDKLDGLTDGVMNNYMACRAIFDVTQGAPNRKPWAAKRCPSNLDPNPADTSASACLTDAQIATLEFVYSPYVFKTPLANGVKSFGMWTPNTDPSGSGLISSVRYRGQEGADDTAAMHSHLGVLGVTGFLMRDLKANPLDYVEGGAFNRRREEISAFLDGTNPDLTAFSQRGGRMIVTIGTNDTLASPGAQLDYYQAVLDRMGRAAVDRFARLYVMPQAGHGLSGTSYTTDGDGKTIPATPIPNTFDRLTLLASWVERGEAPGMSVTVTAGGNRSLPLCSYPAYPKYNGGDVAVAASYACAER
jgi:feruloyl esterase